MENHQILLFTKDNNEIDLRLRELDVEKPNDIQKESVASKVETGVDISKKPSYGKLFKAAFRLLEEYCSNSTLHGVRYFVDKKRHWLEKVWWIGAFVVSMCCCGALIRKSYDNWDQKFVIVGFAGELTPVWEIPFPAVTICPATKLEKFNFIELVNNMIDQPGPPFNITDEDMKRILVFYHLCGDNSFIFTDNFTNNSIYDFIREKAPPLNYTVQKCNFPNEKLLCHFEEIMTEEGLCFTFNMLNGKETYNNASSDYSQIAHNKTASWNVENGYDPNIKISSESYPYRVSGSQSDGERLYVALWLNRNMMACVKQGFKIALHIPGEIPQVSKHFVDLRPWEEAHISVKPIIITTSEGLRPYHPDRRKCYFHSERKLSFVRLYSQRNCELECLSNFTLALCGCVQFYMLRDTDTPICGLGNSDCYDWARRNILNGGIRDFQDKTEEEYIRLNQLVEQCNCLPACNSIIYDVDMQTTDLDKMNKAVLEEINPMRSNLFVSFKENQFITLTRSEVYGIIDFIASCGGLLGLFIGASFLSIVELLYYGSLKVYCNSRAKINRKNKMSISTTIKEASDRILRTPHEIQEEIGADLSERTSCGKRFQAAFRLLEEYCSNSTLHGVRYFVDKKRHWLEKVWWIVAFAASMCCCGALIHRSYNNWDSRMVIVSFDGELTPVWEIPFPAVTICPSTQLNHFNITKLRNNIEEHPGPPFNITDEELKVMFAHYALCGGAPSSSKFPDNFADSSINDLIREKAPSIYDSVRGGCGFYSWKSCEFEEIMTEEGLCITFNMLNGRETYTLESSDYSQMGHNRTARWNLENGYDSDINNNAQAYPYRAFGSGSENDFFYTPLLLDSAYLRHSCDEPCFKIVLHTPGEIPQPSKYYFRLPGWERALVSVKPTIITTSIGLRPYHPDRRQCYFDSERKLRFLRLYTQRNCELECLSNFTLALCGCVQFYMPRVANTPICGPAKIDCYVWARDNLLNGRLRQGHNITEEEIIRLNRLVEYCNCLPPCNSITYDMEILKSSFHKGNVKNPKIRNLPLSYLTVSFKENKFITLSRSELYGTIDFVANCGGLLGLFIAASFLSIVELLYYCSLRLYFNSRTRMDRKRENKTSMVPIIMVKEAAERSSRK